jgi:hypothetical protein
MPGAILILFSFARDAKLNPLLMTGKSASPEQFSTAQAIEMQPSMVYFSASFFGLIIKNVNQRAIWIAIQKGE